MSSSSAPTFSCCWGSATGPRGARKNVSADYFLASRDVGWLAVGASLLPRTSGASTSSGSPAREPPAARGRALRVARLLHAAAPGLVVRAVLTCAAACTRCRVPRAPLQPRRALVLHVGVHHRVRAHEDQRHAVRRRRRDAGGDGLERVDQRGHPDRRDRPLHRPGRAARGHLHRSDAGRRADHRLSSPGGTGARRGGWVVRARRRVPADFFSMWKPASHPDFP